MNLIPKKQKNESKTLNSLPKDYLLLQQSAQDFMPVEKIRDSMYQLPNHLYRMVVEVKSINYYLKTQEEQETIEAQFRNALGSWDFSFAFYTQTRTIDADDVIKRLNEDISKMTTQALRDYGREYVLEMENLTRSKNGNLIKRNYVIISCNDAETISTNKTEDDFADYAFDKLSLNARKVEEALAPIGLACHLLDNMELMELFYVAVNKHSVLKAEEILDFASDMVVGKNTWDVNKANLLVDGLLQQLRDMLLRDHDLTAAEINQAQNLINKIESFKNESENKQENNLFVL